MTPLAALWTNWLFTSTWPIVGKIGVSAISAELLAFLGAVLGFIYFLPWLVRNHAFSQLTEKKYVPNLLIMGAFGSAFPIALFTMGLQYTTPANAAILAQVEVVYSLILTHFMLKEKITRKQLMGTGLVVFGTLLILYNERFSPRWKGDLLILSMPWMYQVSHIFAKKLPADFSPERIASSRAFYAALVMIPIVLWRLFSGGAHFAFKAGPVSALLFFGLCLNGFVMVLWYRAIRHMELSKATAIILSYPVMTFIISVLTGMEKMHIYQIAGLACAMGGAYWVTTMVKNGGTADERKNPSYGS